MINEKWDLLLKEEYKKEYFIHLMDFIKMEYQKKIVYPKREMIFNALKGIEFENIKVVIIGQDPYHGEGEAHGLAFSVENSKTPHSLQNIFKELKMDLNVDRTNGNLEDWVKQGVLLLNSVLTVVKDQPKSHCRIGWEQFTDKIIQLLNERKEGIVFVLWGNDAREKKKYITNPVHYIIESAHPSPFSYYRGFKGSKPFSKINKFLIKCHKNRINW